MCPQSLSDKKIDVNYKIDVFIFGPIAAFAHRAKPIVADKIAKEFTSTVKDALQIS